MCVHICLAWITDLPVKIDLSTARTINHFFSANLSIIAWQDYLTKESFLPFINFLNSVVDSFVLQKDLFEPASVWTLSPSFPVWCLFLILTLSCYLSFLSLCFREVDLDVISFSFLKYECA